MSLTKHQASKIVDDVAEALIEAIEKAVGTTYGDVAWERVFDDLSGALWNVVMDVPLPAALRTTEGPTNG